MQTNLVKFVEHIGAKFGYAKGSSKKDDLVGDSRASKEYWEALWREGKLPRAINPRDHSLKNEVGLKFDVLFRELFAAEKHPHDAINLLELGCARSAWLPYFSKEWGVCVTGIDYSPLGCDQARAILAMEGVEGDVTLADISFAPQHLLNRFDYVCLLYTSPSPRD